MTTARISFAISQPFSDLPVTRSNDFQADWSTKAVAVVDADDSPPNDETASDRQ